MLKIDPPMNVALFIYHDMVHKWYNKQDTTCLLRKERSVRVKKQHHKRTRGKYLRKILLHNHILNSRQIN